ncbi:MAG: DUF2760 domain-containing protein [Gammaproteobacteria bacterium]
MNFDFTRLPEQFDAFHVAFAGVALVELILLVILLSLIVIGWMRKGRPAEESRVKPEKALETAAPSPAPVAIPKPEKKPTAPPVTLKEATPDAALQLLGLLQQEARFIDFIEEDIQSYSDTEIGAAARIVHEGCHKVLHNHFEFSPIRPESENSRVTVKAGFDPATLRLTGNIVGKAPFNGTLVHRGWQVTDIRLPKLSEHHNVKVVAAAEVEL